MIETGRVIETGSMIGARPLSERVCDAANGAFAGWTLVFTACVFTGRSLDQLVLAALSALLVGLFALFLFRRRVRAPGHEPREVPRGGDRPRGAPFLLVAASLVAASTWILGIDLRIAWSVTVGVLLAAFFASRPVAREEEAQPAAAAGRPRELAVWMLAAAAALLTLMIVRPDYDDAHYVNVATAAVDAPDAPLLCEDTIHGIPGLPLFLPVYRLQSYEFVGGVIARITGTEVIGWQHLLVPALAAVMAVLASARLLRSIAPQRWLAALFVLVLVLLLAGERHRWYGNFSFIRFQHGKAVMLSVALPLVLAYAIEYSRRASFAGWLRLAAAQITAVGLSANALWLAPLAAGTALFAGMGAGVRSLRSAAIGLTACFYPLAFGLALRGETAESVFVPARQRSSQELVHFAIERVLGNGALAASSAVGVLCLWWILPPGRARRLALALPLVFLLLLNPFSAQLIASELTSFQTYWRVLWLLPVPLFLALVLTAPLDPRARIPRRARPIVCAAVVALFLALVPAQRALSSSNRVRFAPFQIAVRPEYHVARILADLVPPGAPVLSCLTVAAWIPTLPHPPRALVVSARFLLSYVAQLGQAEVERRNALASWLSGIAGSATPADVVAAVADYELHAVCLLSKMRGRDALVRELELIGFRLAHADGEYEIFVRDDPEESAPVASSFTNAANRT